MRSLKLGWSGIRTALVATVFTVSQAAAGFAQSIIRDAGIEHALGELARPILNAAGLSPDRVEILLINDNSLNAFVINSQAIFIHSGLVTRVDEPGMLQAVIAHEAAHIANGHLARRAANARNARTAAGLGLLLSAAVAASGNAQAATGVALGSASAAQRNFFAHTRSEENSADQSAARYMAAAGVDPQYMVDVLDIFRGQEALSVGRRDPYALTHPLSRDRLRAARGYAAGYQIASDADSASRYWFLRARAKLSAFLGNPGRTLRQLRRAETNEIVLMQRAIAYHRLPDLANALENIDALIARRPNDPYAHELKGQILLEGRNPSAAVNSYQRAVNLAPRHPLLLAGLGRALVAQNTAASNRRALQVLEQARGRDTTQPRMLRDLAVAYSRDGNNGMASLVTAERYALTGRLSDALTHARRAEGLLPRGSTGWNRAMDVIITAEAAN
ncbi:M48 family metalloprotease [Cochlodiniinecator piscidefendens]|uniref:M48 family metalloprotease n=1 Tax=Cochlodiniinecator piscidefendens TaxID=2715756 RepID=UPI001408E859|nr:M48 family metalloprotease [Cochlodiniinecator piscidefendens]